MRRRAAGVLLLPLLLGSCSAAESLRPASVGSDQYRLTAVYDDALNLSDGAPVKIGGVVVGKVVDVQPDDYRARVQLAVDDDVRLPTDSSFRLRYTTALGELYVDAVPGRRTEELAQGAVVEGPAVTTAPTVEDSLASASLLVNGGGLGEVQAIVSELNTALGGRVGSTKRLLGSTDEFLRQALLSTREIDRVLRSLRDASRTLDRREATIDKALRQIRPAARTLTDNTADLARLLRDADDLAVTADALVRRTRDDLMTVLTGLGPVLDELNGVDDQLMVGLRTLDEFGTKLDAAVPGDYLNLFFTMRLDDVAGLDLSPRGFRG